MLKVFPGFFLCVSWSVCRLVPPNWTSTPAWYCLCFSDWWKCWVKSVTRLIHKKFCLQMPPTPTFFSVLPSFLQPAADAPRHPAASFHFLHLDCVFHMFHARSASDAPDLWNLHLFGCGRPDSYFAFSHGNSADLIYSLLAGWLGHCPLIFHLNLFFPALDSNPAILQHQNRFSFQLY